MKHIVRLISYGTDRLKTNIENTLKDEGSDWSHLPLDLLELILLYVRVPDLGQCVRVCKAWNSLFQEESLWKWSFDAMKNFHFAPDPAASHRNKLGIEKVLSYQVSSSGKYISVVSQSDALDDFDFELSIAFVEEDFKIRKLQAYVSELMDEDDGKSGPPQPKFNETDTLLMVQSVSDHQQVINIFQVPDFDITRTIELPDTSEYTTAVWLGKKTLIRTGACPSDYAEPSGTVIPSQVSGLKYSSHIHAYQSNCKAKIPLDRHDPFGENPSSLISIYSATTGDRVVYRSNNVCLQRGALNVVDNTLTGKREVLWSDCLLSPCIFMWPVSSSISSDCVVKNYASGDVTDISLELEDKKHLAQERLIKVDTSIANRIFIFFVERSFYVPHPDEFWEDRRPLPYSNTVTMSEYDLEYSELRRVQLQGLLSLKYPIYVPFVPFGCEYETIDISSSNGLFLFKYETKSLEASEFRLSLWEPKTGCVAHREIKNHDDTWSFHVSEYGLKIISYKLWEKQELFCLNI